MLEDLTPVQLVRLYYVAKRIQRTGLAKRALQQLEERVQHEPRVILHTLKAA